MLDAPDGNVTKLVESPTENNWIEDKKLRRHQGADFVRACGYAKLPVLRNF